MDLENYCVCKQRYMNEKLDELLKEIKAYRNDMVARNYPFQQISDIITKWETKKIKTVSEELQDELEPITEERKSTEWTKGYNKWKENK